MGSWLPIPGSLNLEKTMATSSVKYFSGDQEVKNPQPLDNKKFAAAFPDVRGVRSDGYSKLVGWPFSGLGEMLPITRIIFFKANPSLHKCDGRCLNATGRNCECSCRGKNHGAGNSMGHPLATVIQSQVSA